MGFTRTTAPRANRSESSRTSNSCPVDSERTRTNRGADTDVCTEEKGGLVADGDERKRHATYRNARLRLRLSRLRQMRNRGPYMPQHRTRPALHDRTTTRK